MLLYCRRAQIPGWSEFSTDDISLFSENWLLLFVSLVKCAWVSRVLEQSFPQAFWYVCLALGCPLVDRTVTYILFQFCFISLLLLYYICWNLAYKRFLILGKPTCDTFISICPEKLSTTLTLIYSQQTSYFNIRPRLHQ